MCQLRSRWKQSATPEGVEGTGGEAPGHHPEARRAKPQRGAGRGPQELCSWQGSPTAPVDSPSLFPGSPPLLVPSMTRTQVGAEARKLVTCCPPGQRNRVGKEGGWMGGPAESHHLCRCWDHSAPGGPPSWHTAGSAAMEDPGAQWANGSWV